MKRFDAFITEVLRNEGGYVNDPTDKGGETNFGISKRSFPNEDIRLMTKDRAIEIYKEKYWNSLYNEIILKELAFKLFDIGINIGVTTAVKKLQVMISSHRPIEDDRLIIDGSFGPKTLKALNEDILSPLGVFVHHLEGYYEGIVNRNKSQKKFMKGWMKRLHHNPAFKGIE